MTADRELLELAAKAAGVCLHPVVERSYGNWGCDRTCTACKKDPSDASWNPLADDGDALRLAVKLHINLEFSSGQASSDPFADTRRAIVLVAAATGRAMSS